MANIPPPIQAGGQQRRRPILEELLLSLLSQTPELALGLLQSRAASGQKQAAAQTTDVAERGALSGALGGPLAETLIPMIYGAGGMGAPGAGIPFGQPDVSQLPKGAAGTILSRGLEVEQLAAPKRREVTQAAQAASKEAAIRRAQELARTHYARMVKNDPSAMSIYDFAASAIAGGLPASTVESLLPPASSELRGTIQDLEAHMQVVQAQDEQTADTAATSWLKRVGIIPASDPTSRVPGAAKTFLALKESEARRREGEKPINWLQEGIDYITGRVGEAAGGTGTLGMLAGAPTAITVDQAVGEWASILTQFAPEAVAEAELKRLSTGAFRTRLEEAQVTQEIAQIIRVNPTNDTAARRVMQRYKYSDEKIDRIIRAARSRILRESQGTRITPP